MLQEEARDLGEAELIPDLKRIEDAGRRLVSLIRDELAPERFTAGRIDLRELHAALRTPLNHVIGYGEMLLEKVEGRADGALAPDLRRILGAGREFLRLVADLLVPANLAPSTAPEPAVDSAARPGALALERTSNAPAQAATPLAVETGTVLVVDDDPSNRDLLARRLARHGFDVLLVPDGESALHMISERTIDLVLLDMVMPGLGGDEVLARLKASPLHRDIPVVMLSALDEMDSVVRCILMGAEDYLAKPVNAVLLRARIDTCLEKRRLRQQERQHVKEIESERRKSEALLLNILPEPIADRLKQGETTIVDSLPEVSVLFADLVGFTELSVQLTSVDLVRLLDDVFSAFDLLARNQGLEKIKTIGDAYMVVGGLPTPRSDHAVAIAELALSMLEEVRRRSASFPSRLELRIGIATGPVIAGIIGRHKFNYDLWGDTVNTASRMESHGLPGRIQITERTRLALGNRYRLESRGEIEVKGKGRLPTWFLVGRAEG